MLKKIHVIKLLISKANNFEAIINKDRVTFPPKCFGGGGGLCKSPSQKRKEFPKLQPQSTFFLAPIRVYCCK